MSEKISPFDEPAEKVGPYNKAATDLQDIAEDFKAMQGAVDVGADKPGRLPWVHYFLKLADVVSTRATCDRAYMGCLLVKDNNIIASGYNGSIKGLPHCNDWTHQLEPSGDWTWSPGTRVPLSIRTYRCRCGAKGMKDELREVPCSQPVDAGAGHLMEEGHCVRTVHAEQNALVQAAKFGKATNGATAYVNGYPCWRCFMLLANAGIIRIVYSKTYRNDPKVQEAAKAANIEIVHTELTNA